MPSCFDPQCHHRSGRDSCKMFRFPKDRKTAEKWEIIKLRRKDRDFNPNFDRVCSCHFADGRKENGPTLFKNNLKKIMLHCQPELSSKKSKRGVHGKETIAKLQNELEKQDTLNKELTKELENLKNDNNVNIFDVSIMKQYPNLLSKYTGLPGVEEFNFLVDIIAQCKIDYFRNWVPRSMSIETQLLITLIKLRHNFPNFDLAYRFKVSETTIQNIFITFIHVLHSVLFKFCMNDIPSLEKTRKVSFDCYKSFPNVRLILDCTEIAISVPKSMAHQSLTYSHYKNKNTFKGLLGISTNCVIVFMSDLYPGSTSDREIVIDSKILHKLKSGDQIMADKGFLIYDLLPNGVTLNIPPFLTGPQFEQEQVQQTYNIAQARIHVERAIQSLKTFTILNKIPAHLRSMASLIFQTCGALCLLKKPLIKN